ncbi:MAG: AtpZ/AtpI family protein [Caldilineaceae bacterium]
MRRKGDSVWFGLGMFGLVGWSVAVPTLAFAALGIWIDRTWPSRYSWTLMLLLLGVGLGCASAWYWLTRASGRPSHGSGRKRIMTLTALRLSRIYPRCSAACLPGCSTTAASGGPCNGWPGRNSLACCWA